MEAEGSGLRLCVEEDGEGVTVLYVKGEVDIATAPELQESLGRLDGNVVVDLTDAPFLDSSGIRALALARKRLLPEGSLVLRNPIDIVARALEITGLSSWIEK